MSGRDPDPRLRQLRMESLQAMSEAARRADNAAGAPPRGPRPPLRRVHGDVSTAPHIHGAYIPPPPAEAAEQPPRSSSVCSGHSGDGYSTGSELDTDIQPAQWPDRRRIEPIPVIRDSGHSTLQERPEADETRRCVLGGLRPRGRRLRVWRGHLCVHSLARRPSQHAIDAAPARRRHRRASQVSINRMSGEMGGPFACDCMARQCVK